MVADGGGVAVIVVVAVGSREHQRRQPRHRDETITQNGRPTAACLPMRAEPLGRQRVSFIRAAKFTRADTCASRQTSHCKRGIYALSTTRSQGPPSRVSS